MTCTCRKRKLLKGGLLICVIASIFFLCYYSSALSHLMHFSVRYADMEPPFAHIPLPLILPKQVLYLSPVSRTNDQNAAASANISDNKDADTEEISKPMLPVARSNKSWISYRSLHHIKGWMETNKMNDDYSFCPRREPFLGPYKYDHNTKNPCWSDGGVYRCLPYFYLAGFSKCGTSDLFYKIGLHPEVIFTNSKEMHWFDYYRFVEDMRLIQNYTDMFARAATVIKTDLDTTGFSKKVTGDGTPCYVWGSLNWPCYEGNEGLYEPRFTNADIIYRLNPKTKVIVMLREPVSRLYSRMLSWIVEPLHPVYVNASPGKFHRFIEERVAMYRKCFTRWSVRHCAYNGTLYKEAVLRLMEGAYSVYLKDWLQVFPREQLLFIKFDDYVSKLSHTLNKVFSFLELAPLDEEQMKKILDSGTTNKGKHYDVGPMLNETREILREFYRPFNEELPFLLQDPSFTWDYTQ